LQVGCAVDIDEGEVAALVSKIAEALLVDVLEYVGQNCLDVITVFLVVVDNVVGFL